MIPGVLKERVLSANIIQVRDHTNRENSDILSSNSANLKPLRKGGGKSERRGKPRMISTIVHACAPSSDERHAVTEDVRDARE